MSATNNNKVKIKNFLKKTELTSKENTVKSNNSFQLNLKYVQMKQQIHMFKRLSIKSLVHPKINTLRTHCMHALAIKSNHFMRFLFLNDINNCRLY